MNKFFNIVCASVISAGFGQAAVNTDARFNPSTDYEALTTWIDRGAFGTANRPDVEACQKYDCSRIGVGDLGKQYWKEKVVNRFISMKNDGKIYLSADSDEYRQFSRELFDGSEEVAEMLREVASLLDRTTISYNDLEDLCSWTCSPYVRPSVSVEKYNQYYGSNFWESMENWEEHYYGASMPAYRPWIAGGGDRMPLVIDELCEDLYAAWGGQYVCHDLLPKAEPSEDGSIENPKKSCLLL